MSLVVAGRELFKLASLAKASKTVGGAERREAGSKGRCGRGSEYITDGGHKMGEAATAEKCEEYSVRSTSYREELTEKKRLGGSETPRTENSKRSEARQTLHRPLGGGGPARAD
jgi:hypothetical protein